MGSGQWAVGSGEIMAAGDASVPFVLRPVAALGRYGLATTEFIGGLGQLLWATAKSSRHAFVSKKWRYEWGRLAFQMVRVGVRAIPIVSLVLFCIGLILSLQIGPILGNYGANDQISYIIGVALFRELGPLVGAIVLTGFAGASIAAELGSMVINEEIEALTAHAIHPVRFLVVPRVAATIVMMVCLAIVADLTGLAGGAAAGYFTNGTVPSAFFRDSFASIELKDFFTGLFKAAVFGMLVSGLACYLGLRVSGGAQGVGQATTRTVVLTIVFLILVDLAFTALFFSANI